MYSSAQFTDSQLRVIGATTDEIIVYARVGPSEGWNEEFGFVLLLVVQGFYFIHVMVQSCIRMKY